MIRSVCFINYDKKKYYPGNKLKIAIWYIVNVVIFMSSIPFPSKIKVLFLKLFGAKIGNRVTIKPRVNIKYPWFLSIGDSCWIGESVWIDNLACVTIGSNVCISQGAYLLTGSHDYKKSSFDLIVKPIAVEDGAWIGAYGIVCPGVICKTHSVLSVASVATSDMQEYSIYQGNPAMFKKKREIAD